MSKEAEYFNTIGIELLNQVNLKQAAIFFYKSVTMSPDNSQYHNNLAITLQRIGNYIEAITYFEKAIKLQPGDSELYFNLGLAQAEMGNIEEAKKDYLAAINLKPSDFRFYNNIAYLYMDSGEYQKAYHLYDQCMKNCPENPNILSNIGVSAKEMGKYSEAEKYYLHALNLEPQNYDARFNLSNILLLTGRFNEGWQNYEYRNTKINLKANIWNGENVKKLYVLAEQGFGDIFQFCRYLLLAKERVDDLVFICPPKLKNLIESSFSSFKVLDINYSDLIKPNDFYINLLSLPGLFKTDLNSIPLIFPYIIPELSKNEKWFKKLAIFEKFKIGINWEPNLKTPSRKKRMVNLNYFYSLAKIKGIQLFSLQKGGPENELNELPEPLIINLSDEISDFSDTAAIINNLDLVISVDTAVVHLAGGLAKPVWTLLPYVPDWRWLLRRLDSPWYPGMRLFRQKTPDDWSGVFSEIENDLKNY